MHQQKQNKNKKIKKIKKKIFRGLKWVIKMSKENTRKIEIYISIYLSKIKKIKAIRMGTNSTQSEEI